MSDFRNYLNQQLKDPAFKAEWDALQPELAIKTAVGADGHCPKRHQQNVKRVS